MSKQAITRLHVTEGQSRDITITQTVDGNDQVYVARHNPDDGWIYRHVSSDAWSRNWSDNQALYAAAEKLLKSKKTEGRARARTLQPALKKGASQLAAQLLSPTGTKTVKAAKAIKKVSKPLTTSTGTLVGQSNENTGGGDVDRSPNQSNASEGARAKPPTTKTRSKTKAPGGAGLSLLPTDTARGGSSTSAAAERSNSSTGGQNTPSGEQQQQQQQQRAGDGGANEGDNSHDYQDDDGDGDGGHNGGDDDDGDDDGDHNGGGDDNDDDDNDNDNDDDVQGAGGHDGHQHPAQNQFNNPAINNLHFNVVLDVTILNKLDKTRIRAFFESVSRAEMQQNRLLQVEERNHFITEECRKQIDLATRQNPQVLRDMGIQVNPLRSVPWQALDTATLKTLLLKLVAGSKDYGENLGYTLLERIIGLKPGFDGYKESMDHFVEAVHKLFDELGCVSQEDREAAITTEQFKNSKSRLMSMMHPREVTLNLAPEFNMKIGSAVTSDNPNTFWEWFNSFTYRYYEYAREVDAIVALRRPQQSTTPAPKTQSDRQTPNAAGTKRPQAHQQKGSNQTPKTSHNEGPNKPREKRLCNVCGHVHPIEKCKLWVHPMSNHQPAIAWSESPAGKYLAANGRSQLPRTETYNTVTHSWEPWSIQGADVAADAAAKARRGSFGGQRGGQVIPSETAPQTIILATAILTDSNDDITIREGATNPDHPSEGAVGVAENAKMPQPPKPASTVTARAIVADGLRSRGTRVNLLLQQGTPQLLLDTGTKQKFHYE
jgi:hypothetical protein